VVELRSDALLCLSDLRPEKKLRPRLRREFRRTTLGIAAALIATCVLCGMLVRNVWTEVGYARRGVATTGIVIAANIEHRTRKSISYSFILEGGEHRVGFASHSMLATYHEGDEIAVQYLWDDPAANRPAPTGWLDRLSLLGPGVAAALFVGIGVYLLRYRRRSVDVLMRILTQGVLTRGIVLTKERYRRRHRKYYRVTYAFALPSGAECESEDSLVDGKFANPLKPGSPVAVAVLLDEPERCYLFRPRWLTWFEDDEGRHAVEAFVHTPAGAATEVGAGDPPLPPTSD